MLGQLDGSYKNKTYSSPEGAVKAVIDELEDFETRALPLAVRISLTKYLRFIAGRMAARHNSPYSGQMPSQNKNLQQRTGAGVKSILDSVKVEDAGNGDVLGKIGGIFYLATQEHGAVIRAKRGGYLTIPLPAALDARGVPRKRRAREWQDTFIKRSTKGNLIIFQKRAGGIVPLYVLKKVVRIPKRLGLKDDLVRYMNLFGSFLEKEIRKEFRL